MTDLGQGEARWIPSVEHQDHCSFLEERGCDCEPEVLFPEVPSLEAPSGIRNCIVDMALRPPGGLLKG